MQSQIILKPGKEKSIKQGHPWIFSGAIQRVQKADTPGTAVDVCDHRGQFLVRAYYNAKSSLAARVFSRKPGQELDGPFLETQIRAALARRAPLVPGHQTMRRVVASEADFLPGLIVDQYGEHLVFQILTAGMELRRDSIIAAQTLYDYSDEPYRWTAVSAPFSIQQAPEAGSRFAEPLAAQFALALDRGSNVAPLIQGPEHCSAQDQLWWLTPSPDVNNRIHPVGYYRDGDGKTAPSVPGARPFDPAAELPADAAFTGQAVGNAELWLTTSDNKANGYLVNKTNRDDVERWPALTALCA